MSMSEWTPESVRQYERAIKASRRQRASRVQRKEQWLNDFIDGKPVKQFDEFVAHNAEGQGCRASRHTLDPLVGASVSGGGNAP